MKIHDIHTEQKNVVLLLHPMLATAQMMQELLAEPMGNTFRYIIPDFSGHGEAADSDYESAAKEAQQLSISRSRISAKFSWHSEHLWVQ